MKCKILIVCLCFQFVSTSLAQVSTDGLVAYYPFNGNANDESGKGNNGVVNGAILTEDRNGNSNSAYHFDGSDDFIEVADADNLHMTDDMSISLWFKSSGTDSFSGLVIKASDDAIRAGYLVYLDANKFGSFGVIFNHQTDVYKTAKSTYSLTDDEWHHLVGIYNGEVIRIYVDCQLEQEVEYSVGADTNSESLYIGYDPDTYGGSRYFTGDIDDVMIFNRAIDINEVMELCEDNYISISGDNEVCQGVQGLIYTVQSIDDAVNYTWSYSGTGVSVLNNDNSASLNFDNNATSGNLTVEVETSDGTMLNSELFYIDVNLLPGGSYEILGEEEVCRGESESSYSIPEIDNATSYVWDFDGDGVTIENYANEILADFGEGATSGYLSVYGKNSCGIGDTSELYVNVLSAPEAAGELEGDNTICLGENGLSYSIPEIENASTYFWQYDGEGATIIGNSNEVSLSFSTEASSGYLSAYGYNSCGEGEASSLYINVISCTTGDGFSTIRIPNSFSPNGDNINDLFVIQGLVENATFIVFSRNGKKLYETNNYQNDWDGVDVDGNVLSTGTYWCVIKIPGISTPHKGFVYLKR